MDDGRHEGFRRQRSSSLSSIDFLREPLVDGEAGSQPDVENNKHVHWSASTRSLSGLGRLSMNERNERPSDSGYGGEYVKSIVYGGLDAIVTSFALVASVSGGGIGAGAVLVLGFANLIADGISMGFGDYLSSTTEQSYAANEQKIAGWDVQNDPQAEAANMIDVYQRNGMDRNDAEEVVKIFAKYNDLMVDQKMAIDDGLLPPDEEDEVWKNGIVTFVSFICFGCTPLLSYLVLNPFTKNQHIKFGVACLVTGFALILLGVAKARISGENTFNSAVTVLSNGGFAAGAAYGISWVLKNSLGIDEP